MPNYTVTLTAEQEEGLTAAQKYHDLHQTPKVNTPTAYLQKIVNMACDSYVKQHVTVSVESLSLKVAVLTDAKAQLESELAAEKAKAATATAELEALKEV